MSVDHASTDWAPVPMPTVRLTALPGRGPEDVLFRDDRRVLTGLRDGRVVEADLDDGRTEVVLDTGGLPLGLEWLPDGRLLVCDAERGLLACDLPSGAIEVLTDSVGGEPLPFCNNAAVAPDGAIFFTSSSTRYGFREHLADIVERIPTGRLFRRDPDGTVELLADGLAFANGVALTADGRCLFVAETAAARIQRYALTGNRAGTCEVVVELPGLPDNLAVGTDGLVWVAIAAHYDEELRRIHALPVEERSAAARRSPPAAVSRVVALQPDGRVVHDLDGDPAVHQLVTGVRERNGTVVLGSLVATALVSFRIAPPGVAVG